MLEFMRSYTGFLGWMAVLSGVFFIGTLVMVPFLVARMPHDYFIRPARTARPDTLGAKILLIIRRVARNVLGLIVIVAGIAMLALPGQGLLTIVIGLCMIDLPGKRQAMLWLVSRGAVLRSLNWIRRRAGKPHGSPATTLCVLRES